MNYIKIPDSYDEEKIKEQFTEEEFQNLQLVYRKKIEEFLNNFFNIKEVEERINKVMTIPILEDKEYNVYHKYSSLPSNYIYLRNNIHIERLNKEEIDQLKADTISTDFLLKILPKVLFEEGDYVHFGVPILKNQVPSRSIVLEFAYDQVQLINLEEYNKIQKIIEEITEYFQTYGEKILNIPFSVVTYNAIPDLFKPKEKGRSIE